MTSLQLIDQQFRYITPDDTVLSAINLIQTQNCNHIPVVEENLFKGLLSRKEFLDLEKTDITVSHLDGDLLPAAINGSAHFLQAVPVANLYRTDVIPVINDVDEYLGSITHLDLINALGNFCGAGEYGALIVLEIEKPRLVFSELNTIMESDGATILHFNVSPIAATQVMEVSIGIDKKEVSAIIATLVRYNYKILFTSGDENMVSELSDNYNNLMNYLDI